MLAVQPKNTSTSLTPAMIGKYDMVIDHPELKQALMKQTDDLDYIFKAARLDLHNRINSYAKGDRQLHVELDNPKSRVRSPQEFIKTPVTFIQQGSMVYFVPCVGMYDNTRISKVILWRYNFQSETIAKVFHTQSISLMKHYGKELAPEVKVSKEEEKEEYPSF